MSTETKPEIEEGTGAIAWVIGIVMGLIIGGVFGGWLCWLLR